MTQSPIFGRGALERLLGAARFQFTDDGSGLRSTLRWNCGCEAREVEPDRFAVRSCDGHQEMPKAD